ncbi:Hypothetical protein, putative, partial [Bodo saltans]
MFAKKSISAATALPNAKNIKAFLHPTSNRISLFCNLEENHGASSSGKTITIASSGGNKPLGSSNANIGLNVFCKNLESLDLSDKAIGALANLSEVTPGLEWQVVDKHLHFLLDFDKTQPRVAKSEKSTLLMSSSGFKRVGATGISVNMNCYIKTGVTFNPEGLKTFAEVPIQIPENVTVEVSEDGQSLLITADLSDVEVDGMTSIPSVSIGEGLTVNVHIKKVSPSSSTAQAQKSPSKASKKAATFVPVGDSTSVSVSGAGTDNVQFKLDLQDLGFSSTGKTLLRASSKGFQQVGNLRVNAMVYSKDIKPALKEIISKFLATKEDPLTV